MAALLLLRCHSRVYVLRMWVGGAATAAANAIVIAATAFGVNATIHL